MSATGGMGRESRKFNVRLSEMISGKRKENYAFIASCIRRKISFVLTNSLCTCLRGSRSVYHTSNTYSENSLSSFTILLSVEYYIHCMLLLH